MNYSLPARTVTRTFYLWSLSMSVIIQKKSDMAENIKEQHSLSTQQWKGASKTLKKCKVW